MKKTTIFVSKSFSPLNEEGIEVGIVTGIHNNKHTHEYQVFDLKKPVPGIGLIGVKNKDIFALKFIPNFNDRYALAVYLDGINISQTGGIINLNNIKENIRNDYYKHQVFICSNSNCKGIISYLNRFSQKNSENRYFTFTMDKNTGINEILISDPSMLNRIEVYLWKENKEEINYSEEKSFEPEPSSFKNSKIGAGQASNKEYGTTVGLRNPIYLGKAMFIHLPAEKLKHLGETLISVENLNDPMDSVPIS